MSTYPSTFQSVLEEILPHAEQLDSSYEISNKVLAYANDVYITGRDPESCR